MPGHGRKRWVRVRLILVRHALPERASLAEGQADPGLTDLGHRQAARIVDALAGDTVTAIRASPMRRARETAAPLVAALGMPAEVVADLAEFDTGRSRYIPVHEMAESDPDTYARLRTGLLPAGVDVPAFRARVVAAFKDLVGGLQPRDTAVCFAHAGVINAYLGDLLGVDLPMAFALDYAGLTRVTVSRTLGARARTVNEIAHVADLLNSG